MLKRLFAARPAADPEAGERAGQLFDQGYNCAQAVLLANCGEVEPQLLEIAKSFGAGIAGAKCLCGAVSGGVMALSLVGEGKNSDRLVAAFRRHHRVTCCAGLSQPFAWKSREHRQNCRLLTVSAARMVERLKRGEAPESPVGGADSKNDL